MKTKFDFKRFLLLTLGLVFSCIILASLVLIALYGSVVIYEPNRLILFQEIITLTFIVVGYIYQIKADIARVPHTESPICLDASTTRFFRVRNVVMRAQLVK